MVLDPLQPALKLKFEWVSLDTIPNAAPIYMRRPYQLMVSINDGSEPRLLVCRSGAQRLYLPILVKRVGHDAYEGYSAYGYGGFFGDLKLSENDMLSLKGFLADTGIVSLFIRHSPFLSNELVMPDGERDINRYTYSAKLYCCDSFIEYLKGIPQKNRWSANYAIRAGLKVEFHSLENCPREKIHSFYAHYLILMEEKRTSNYYRFSEDFFQNHARLLGNQCEFAEITDKNGQFLGGSFFILDDYSGLVHYHLSAVSREAMKLQGMELLMLAALQRYGVRGYHELHLGGGHSIEESDGLSRFKSKFASKRLEFHCSTLVCDATRYANERSRLQLVHPKFFLISDARGAQSNSSLSYANQ